MVELIRQHVVNWSLLLLGDRATEDMYKQLQTSEGAIYIVSTVAVESTGNALEKNLQIKERSLPWSVRCRKIRAM